jgi:hypothetical protein
VPTRPEFLIPVVASRIADADAPLALDRLNRVFLADGDDKDTALMGRADVAAVVDSLPATTISSSISRWSPARRCSTPPAASPEAVWSL